MVQPILGRLKIIPINHNIIVNFKQPIRIKTQPTFLYFRDELVHGFILVYSTKRRASLSNLSALSVDIPELPLQILAVTEPNGQLANIGGGVYMNTGGSPSDSLSTLLISEGSNLADRLNAHFMTSSASLQQKSN